MGQPQQKAAQAKAGKSGLQVLNAGEVLFNEGDSASSLYIIQKGQLRLYKPKGRGYIELAVLRAGEVLGEMAYFAVEANEKRRSCSAQAIIRTEIIEISFNAFDKTMSNLNPWFKTIVNTLASRLRKTNAKVKELEVNSVSQGYGSSGLGYKFFRNIDVVKILSMIFLVTKSHGEQTPYGTDINKSTITYYGFDIYNLQEAKFEELLSVLKELGVMDFIKDKNNAPNIYRFFNLDIIRKLMNFYNTQRNLVEEKKLKIGTKCEIFLGQILQQIQSKNPPPEQTKFEANLTSIMEAFKSSNVRIEIDDLEEARVAKLVGDVIVGASNNLSCEVNYELLSSVYPGIRLTNAISKVNDLKAGNN
jgi:CRP/FNR family cyclic AMP-dependent transcriptional regulator